MKTEYTNQLQREMGDDRHTVPTPHIEDSYDETCSKCTEYDYAHQIPEVNACLIHQPKKYKEQMDKRSNFRALIDTPKPTPPKTK